MNKVRLLKNKTEDQHFRIISIIKTSCKVFSLGHWCSVCVCRFLKSDLPALSSLRKRGRDFRLNVTKQQLLWIILHTHLHIQVFFLYNCWEKLKKEKKTTACLCVVFALTHLTAVLPPSCHDGNMRTRENILGNLLRHHYTLQNPPTPPPIIICAPYSRFIPVWVQPAPSLLREGLPLDCGARVREFAFVQLQER